NNSDLIKDFSNKVRDNILLYQKKIDEIALFTDKRDKSYEILKKYELKKQRIFDKKHIEFEFKNILIDYDNRKKELSSDIKLIENIIKGIKQNSLHIDQNIIDILINNNIEFETGENFIKNQKKDNRNSLLEKNPLLAYSIILKKDQINKVKDVFKDKFIKSSIPLFFYENTNVDFENNNVFIKINEDLNFIVNVEKRIFEIDKTEKFLNEKENEKKSLENIYKDIANSYNIASNDFRILQEFDYKEDFLYQAEKNERDLLQKTNEIEKKIEILNNENKNAEINIRNNINKLNEKQNKLNLLNVKLHDFNEFIVKDSEYVRILEKRKNLQKTIEKLNKDILLNENEIIKINNEISGLNKNIEIIKNKLTECEKYKLKFSNAQEKSEILKENIEELLSIYENLKKEYSKDFSALIILKEKSINEISEFTKELSRFKFNEEEVNNIEYNIEIEEKTEIDIYLQNNKLNSIISDYNIVDKDISSENRGKEQAFKEIERLDYDKACPRENIKQDFIARKNTINSNRKDYILLEKKLRKEIAEFKKIKQRIDILNLPSSSIIEFDIKDNIEIIYKNLESNYKLFKEQMDNEEKQLIGNYSLLRSEFKHKNQNIDNLFTSIDSMIERKNKKYNEYYYLFERLKDYIIKISELIEINRIRLENVEKNRNDVVFQCFVHAQRVFEELGKIALSSSVKLSEKIRPIQMIKINTDIDNEENAKKRIEKYIDSCIQNIREEKRQNYENEKINKSIFRLMSTRELINQYSGRNSIPVSVYKIDLNTANNRWKKWESAISENSGGEKFVVFFAVISALMAYIRNNTMINNSENLAGKDSRILIMDNPFGPISSQHLLIPLFEIAKKFNTQLICLSDLKQNSIFNCFNLIYMLKIKKSTFEKDEYLKIDRQIKNSENISLDENLEKSIFRTEKLENQQLF
ncbi:MAG: hypothetical protein M0Q02_11305, partial [Candidatus Muirbacterium halophilum]|nr:hypothetical protein [Candidatus Muirbacterium halophilum]